MRLLYFSIGLVVGVAVGISIALWLAMTQPLFPWPTVGEITL